MFNTFVLFDDLPVRIYVKDQQCQFVYANKACLREIGCKSLDALRGHTDLSFFAHDLAQLWMHEDREILRQGTQFVDRPESERWKDGRTSSVLTSKLPIKDHEGNIVGVLGMSRDTTNEQQQAAWFRMAVDSAGDGLWYDDLRTQQRWYSLRWKEMLGYTDAELPTDDLKWRTFVVPEDHAIVDQAMSRCRPDRREFTYVCRMRRKDNRIIWVRCRGKGTFDQHGHPILFAGAHSDITAVRAQEDYYRLLLDTVPSFIFVKDCQFRFTYVNQAMVDAMGKPLLEILNSTDEEHFDPPLVTQFRRVDTLVLSTGRPHNVELERFAHHALGDRFLATIKVPLRRNDADVNSVDGIVGVATDITELRQAQDMLQALLDNVSEGVFFKNIHGHFTKVSHSLAAMVKAPTPDHMLGKTDADYFHRAFAEEALATDQRVLLQGEPVANVVLKSVLIGENPDDVHRWRIVSKVPLRNAQSKIVGLVGISHDVSAIVKQAEELQSQTELLTAILDAIPQKIFVKDRALRYVMCNRPFALGHDFSDPKELIGKTDYDLWPAAQAEMIREVDLRVSARNTAERNFPEQLVDRHGHLRRIVTSKIPLHNVQGVVAGILGICDDITPEVELERQRTRTRQVAESLMLLEDDPRRLDFMLLLEVTHREGLGFNRALYFRYDETLRRLTGGIAIGQVDEDSARTFYESRSEIERVTFEQCLSDYDECGGPPDQELNAEIDGRVIDLGGKDTLVNWIRNADKVGTVAVGSVRTPGELGAIGELLSTLDAREVAVVVLHLRHGERVVLCCDNVRSRQPLDRNVLRLLNDYAQGACVVMSQAMDRRRQRKEAADERAWQDIAQRVAHVLNNIVPFAETALEGAVKALDSNRTLALKRIEDAIGDVRQCKSLIQSFKSFATPLTVRKVEVSANQLRQFCDSWLGGRADIRLDPAASRAFVAIDSEQMSIVIRELAQNADRAVTGDKKSPSWAKLEILIRHATLDEIRLYGLTDVCGWALIAVSDDGPGIAESIRSQVFEPLFSLSKGTGLGLAEAQKIVKAHGGTIAVGQSLPGRGATMCVFLPLVEAE